MPLVPNARELILEEARTKGLDPLADDVLAEALQLVPRDTESLANSGRVEHDDADPDLRRVAFGGPDYPYTGDPSGTKTVDYAKYVNGGTRHMAARPFLTSAALHER